MVPSSVLRARSPSCPDLNESIPGIANFGFAVQRKIGVVLAIDLVQDPFKFHDFYSRCSRC